ISEPPTSGPEVLRTPSIASILEWQRKSTPGFLLSTDQRGVPRPQPQGGASDIGAFEVRSDERTATTWAPAHTATNIDLTNGNLTVCHQGRRLLWHSFRG